MHRLTPAARKIAYGEKPVAAGPSYIAMKREGKRIILTFDNTGSGLSVNGAGELKGFAIAGPDKKFVWAKSRIKGNKIKVWSDRVSDPVAVRYAWADNLAKANLYNREGLPAAPFKTDSAVVKE